MIRHLLIDGLVGLAILLGAGLLVSALVAMGGRR